MSRSTIAAFARPTSASTSPVMKWTTLSVSRLSYGSPQRRTGILITVGSEENEPQMNADERRSDKRQSSDQRAGLFPTLSSCPICVHLRSSAAELILIHPDGGGRRD